MMRQSDLARRLVGHVVRRTLPRWIRDPADFLLDGFERFAPLDRMVLPEGQRLFVVAPHPDDESIGCGGLLALWAQAGRSAQVVFLTSGELGSAAVRDPSLPDARREEMRKVLRTTRRAEARAALAVVGAGAVWLDGTDGSLYRDEDRLSDALVRLWQDKPPDVVAAPDPTDRHADHAVAARIVGRAASRALPAKAVVLAYEVWSPAPANAVLDISAVAETKWRVIGLHRSQTASTDYVGAAEALNRYRAITSGQGEGHAEAFRRCTVVRYAEMAERLRV
jgi:LmbE family N-acetylglucosaminyl deacetylase